MNKESLNVDLLDFNKNHTPIPLYKRYSTKSFYIEMRDGIKIAVDCHIPQGISPNNKISSILVQTRYWRAMEVRSLSKKDYFSTGGEPPGAWGFIKTFTKHGYAVLCVDVRGSGASFGSRIGPYSEDEIKDSEEIIEWIIQQPWSDGNIFPFGISYNGTTAELTLSLNHSAVKGIIPISNELDVFLDIAFPGGVFNEMFLKNWKKFSYLLDRNLSKAFGSISSVFIKGVKPVDIDKEKKKLIEAIEQHSSNLDVYEASKNIIFRDDEYFDNLTMKDFSIYNYKDKIEKSNIPLYYLGSWLDGASASVIIESFLNFKNPFIGVIGPWTHGAIHYASPFSTYRKKIFPKKSQYEAFIRFFDACIRKKISNIRSLYYYTLGEEKWKKTTIWPPEEQIRKKWYFSNNYELSELKSIEENCFDSYEINPEATTGKKCNRWYTQLFGSRVKYKNRFEEDLKLLTYTSPPLKKKIEITGYPIIKLYLSSTHEDGSIFVYLEDIDENNKVYLLTEGCLRLIHRKISNEVPPYKTLVPYHTYKRQDKLPLIPGEITEISFGLLPTSVLIEKGHKIRIAIAGADKDTFIQIPEKENPTIKIARNNENASYIDLPIIEY